ncbi:MAG: ATP-binding cassette domain-containing protein, partial [Beijerinckiaceae bacterium]
MLDAGAKVKRYAAPATPLMETRLATLDVRDITKAFGPTQVLKGVSLSVESGEFFTLLGPSGCGKTTLLRMIAGFLKQDTGAIHVDGEHLDPVPAHRRDIGMV